MIGKSISWVSSIGQRPPDSAISSPYAYLGSSSFPCRRKGNTLFRRCFEGRWHRRV
jgi:hypothetical protein